MIPTIERTLVRTLSIRRLAIAAALLAGALMGTAAPASAVVNSSVRSACMSDYFAYCAGLEVGSTELRRCMNKAGPKLSSACVSALVAAGEVSKAEVDRRSARTASKQRKSATRVASRLACVAGPARPGARYSTSCRSTVASARNKTVKRVATLR